MLSMTVTPQSSALFLPALSKPTTALMENCENEKDDELLKIPDPDLRAAPFMNSSSKAPVLQGVQPSCRRVAGPSGYSAEGWQSLPISTAEPQVQ